MYPAARVLIDDVRQTGAEPIFFVTWAYRYGLPANGMPNYESMQAQIDDGYILTAQALNSPVAPVGVAWFHIRDQYPQMDLWQDDGSHPTTEGTYLAAVFSTPISFVKARKDYRIRIICQWKPRRICKKPRRILFSMGNGRFDNRDVIACTEPQAHVRAAQFAAWQSPF